MWNCAQGLSSSPGSRTEAPWGSPWPAGSFGHQRAPGMGQGEFSYRETPTSPSKTHQRLLSQIEAQPSRLL